MPNSVSQPEERGDVAPLSESQLLAERYAVVSLAGRAAERFFYPGAGLYAVVVHEAAHCVAGYAAAHPVNRVSTIAPDSSVADYTLHGEVKEYKAGKWIPGYTFLSSDQRCALRMLQI